MVYGAQRALPTSVRAMTIASTTTTPQRDQTSHPCSRDIRVSGTHEYARQAEGELGLGVSPPRPIVRSSCSPDSAGDPADDRSPDLTRVLAEGDSGLPRG